MRRILLLGTVALMLAGAMALSGVAQAAPISDKADAQCAKLATKTLGASFNPSNYTFIGGTEGNDDFTGKATDGPDVFCGFGGEFDRIEALDEGDIFLGGAGTDAVRLNYGTFYGQEGGSSVFINRGTVYGGADNFDYVVINSGTVYGGAGNDYVEDNHGTFNGGAGDDTVASNHGTFNGDAGDDTVYTNYEGATFNGGDGNDSVMFTNFGTTDSVENGV
jgi:hypothetical protein